MSDLETEFERERERQMYREAPDLPFGSHPPDSPRRARNFGLWVVGILLALAIPIFYVIMGLASAIFATQNVGVIVAFLLIFVGIAAGASIYTYTRLKRAQYPQSRLRDDFGNRIKSEELIVQPEIQKDSIQNVMKSKPVVCGYLDNLIDVAKEMYHNNVGFLGVLNADDECIGVVTDRDLVCGGLAESFDPKSTPVTQVMEQNFKSVTPEASLRDCIRLMQSEGVRRIPVLEGKRIVGVVSLDDIIARKLCSLDDVAAIFQMQLSEPGVDRGAKSKDERAA